MNNRKELAKLIQQWAYNPDSYFEFNGNKVNILPIPTSDIHNWKLIIPPKKWQPTNKAYCVNPRTNIFTRETQKQSDDLIKLLKEIATIDSWACEFGYKKEFEYDKPNYYICYHAGDKEWTCTSVYYIKNLGRVYMTEEGCKLLCEKIKSGEVELTWKI